MARKMKIAGMISKKMGFTSEMVKEIKKQDKEKWFTTSEAHP